jgi:starch synthase
MNAPLYASFQGGDVTLSPIERRVRALSLRRCRGIAVASARERARLASDYGVVEPVRDIPNPVDAGFWSAQPKAAARAALGLDADELVAFNHGRIDIHRKGLDVLLAAWGRARAARKARLVVVGSGQDRAAFAPLAEAAGITWLADYVTDPPLIRRWLSAADIYVTLSRTEGMPVAPLEAMACSLPVVASDAHGLADLFQGGDAAGGLLVPRGDAEAAAAALARLLDDPALRARLGRAARAQVEARFSTQAVGAGLAQMLRAPGRAGDAAEILAPAPAA